MADGSNVILDIDGGVAFVLLGLFGLRATYLSSAPCIERTISYIDEVNSESSMLYRSAVRWFQDEGEVVSLRVQGPIEQHLIVGIVRVSKVVHGND